MESTPKPFELHDAIDHFAVIAGSDHGGLPSAVRRLHSAGILDVVFTPEAFPAYSGSSRTVPQGIHWGYLDLRQVPVGIDDHLEICRRTSRRAEPFLIDRFCFTHHAGLGAAIHGRISETKQEGVNQWGSQVNEWEFQFDVDAHIPSGYADSEVFFVTLGYPALVYIKDDATVRAVHFGFGNPRFAHTLGRIPTDAQYGRGDSWIASAANCRHCEFCVVDRRTSVLSWHG